ncbi:MAG: hypothetical protein OXQ96_00530 [Alphaproteobacteria bacterium]|nr:hypothetical protein [Alphaproteobacteria bacterium]
MSFRVLLTILGFLHIPTLGFSVLLKAEQIDEKPVLSIAGETLAVVQPKPEELWIISKNKVQKFDEERLHAVTGAKTVEALNISEGSGIRFVYTRPRSWNIAQDGEEFILRQGRTSSDKTRSLMAFKDGIVPAENIETVIDAATLDGLQRLRVGLGKEIAPTQHNVSLQTGTIVPSLIGFGIVDGLDMFVENGHLKFIQNPKALPTVSVVAQDIKPPSINVPKLDIEAEGEKTIESPKNAPKKKVLSDLNIESIHNPEEAILFTLPSSYQSKMLGIREKLDDRQVRYARAFGIVEEAVKQVENVSLPETAKNKQQSTENISAEGGEVQQEVQAPVAIPRQEIFLRKLGAREQQKFRTLEGIKLDQLAEAQTGSEKVSAALDLARVYVAFHRYDQAEGIVRSLPKNDKGIPVDMVARTLLGAVLVLQDRGEEALPVLEGVEDVEEHQTIWLAAAQVQSAQYDAAANNFKNGMQAVSFYPNHVGVFLKILEGKALLETQQYSALFEKMDELALEQLDEQMPMQAKYYVARAYLELGQSDVGRRMLSEVSEEGGGKDSIQAKLDFILDMARTKDLLSPQVILFLEDLRFFWRGDELEGEMLKELGSRYVERRSYRTALDRFKTYSVAFPEAEDIGDVTNTMRQAFVEVFDPQNRYMLDDLGLLGMYYDFRELTPANEKGDRLVQDVGIVLDKVLLYERAIALFERQLEFRVKDPAEKARLSAELASLYRKNSQPYDALATLDRWGKDVEKSPEIEREYALERARALLNLEMFTEAWLALEGMLDDTARSIQVDIGWQSEDYAAVARLLAQMFDTNEYPSFEEVQTRTDFIRLVYALVQLNEQDALVQLLQNYKADLKEYPEMADIINVYAARAKVDEKNLVFTAGRPLQRIAKQLLALNEFEADYDKKLETLSERRRLREIYNQKQDYMDYLREGGLL